MRPAFPEPVPFFDSFWSSPKEAQRFKLVHGCVLAMILDFPEAQPTRWIISRRPLTK